MSAENVQRFRDHANTLLQVYREGFTVLADAVERADRAGVDLATPVMHALEHFTRGFAYNLIRGQYERISASANFAVSRNSRIVWPAWVPEKAAAHTPGATHLTASPTPTADEPVMKTGLVLKHSNEEPVPVKVPVDSNVEPVPVKVPVGDEDTARWNVLSAAELLEQRHPSSCKVLVTQQQRFTLGAAIDYLRMLGYDGDDGAFVLPQSLAAQYDLLTRIGVGRSLSALSRYGIVEMNSTAVPESTKPITTYVLTKRSYEVYDYAKKHDLIPSWRETRKIMLQKRGAAEG